MGHHAAGHLSQLSTVEICEFMPVPYLANILAVLIDEGIESTQGPVNGTTVTKAYIIIYIYMHCVYIYNGIVLIRYQVQYIYRPKSPREYQATLLHVDL